MLKEEITYEDFNGQTQKDIFYFNLTELEIAKMATLPEGGLEAVLTRIVETDDQYKIIEQLEGIILGAVGEVSDDGKKFVKIRSDGTLVKNDFAQHAAYSALLTKMSQDDTYLVTWMSQVFPKEYAPGIEKAAKDAQALLGLPENTPKTPPQDTPPPPPVPPAA